MGTLTRNIMLAVAGIATAALIALAAVATASDAGLDRSQDWLKPRIDKRHKELYDGLWRRKVSPENKRWARRVAACESGRNPDALGADGIYRGAFQFGEGTWKTAPQSPGGDPIAYSYRTQAFVAVRLKGRDGAGHWPNCP